MPFSYCQSSSRNNHVRPHMKKRRPTQPRRLLKERDTKRIKELRAEITIQELKYNEVITDQSQVSSMSKEFDELSSKANLISVEIDNLKKKIENIIRTGKQNGQSLEKDYELFLPNKFML